MAAAARQRGVEPMHGVAEVRDAREDGGEGHPAGDVAERRVAAEQLVAAGAGHGHFQSELVRRLADEVGVEPVDARLVHRLEDARQLRLECRQRQLLNGVPHAVPPRHGLG